MARSPVIDKAYVLEAAKLAQLELDEAALGGVTANLERIAGFARMLEQVPLATEDEAAPVWRP